MQIPRDFFANLVQTFHTTFMRVSHKCHMNFHVSRTRRGLVMKVLNMFKYFMQFFFAKICPNTVVQQSYDLLASVPNLSPQNFGEFTMQKLQCKNFISYECIATVTLQS